MTTADVRVMGRIARFVNERVRPGLYIDARPLGVTAWTAPGEPVPFAEASRQAYVPVAPPYPWGRAWSTTWFRITGEVPGDWVTADTAPEVVMDLGYEANSAGFQAEGLVWTPQGETVKAIQPYNQHIPVLPGPLDLFVEAAANPPIFGTPPGNFRPTHRGEWATAGDEPLYTLRCAEVRRRSLPTWELLQDIAVLTGLAAELPATSSRRAAIVTALTAMVDAVDPDDVHGTAPTARAVLRPVLDQPAAPTHHRIYATGHAHIDCAWLWPLRETKRKCARTFANQVTLMDQDPTYVFGCSSAQQLDWIKQGYPGLYARIREKVAAGQFAPIGSLWVEADTNMTGGEAFARQLLLGKRFFLDEYGVETREVWLPDTFGYSGALPQLARLAGCTWFLSQKMSWNDTNVMPHHTFWWEGIDGSRVFTHFPPADTYNSDLSPKDLVKAETDFSSKGVVNSSLVPFGWGDGGGGPTREMLAAARRSANLEGLPTVLMAAPARFFAETQAAAKDVPVWVGEMYLEFHRGTYTSQAATKAGNRRSEHLLREAELWAATAAVRAGAPYPYDELGALWRTVLLHQFHDILPGSSISWVHREAEATHAEVAAAAEALIARAGAAAVGAGETPLLLNATPGVRAGVPGLGAGVPVAAAGEPVTVGRTSAGTVLGNGLVRLTIADDGTFASLVDVVAGRETVPPGTRGNLLKLYRDQPRTWDAWDLDREYVRVGTELTAVTTLDVTGDDDARVVTIAREFGASRITQRVTVRRGSAAVEITSDIDWHEQEKLLKWTFPLDVRADRAAYETQFGHVWRSTYPNTSWDEARYEVCAHRWVYVGEPGYGVGIANSATYGHDVRHAVTPDGRPYTAVGLSLLRAPKFPDPRADAGRHVRTVVLHPGASLAQTIVDGYETNLLPRVVHGGHAVEPLVSVDHPAVVVEAVKLAEDRSGDVIVRLYESLGGRAEVTVMAGFPVRAVVPVDLLERPWAAGDPMTPEWEAVDGGVRVNVRGFQIITLRFTPSST